MITETCDHVSKIIKWKLNERTQHVPGLYGCTKCNIESEEPLSNGMEVKEHLHTSYVDGCFRCKISTIQLNTGDASSNVIASGWTKKSWNSELDLYQNARSQGIQPDGTSAVKVRQAIDVSDKTGYAYGSDL